MDITRKTDEETGLRWYTDGDISVMSVTTVLKFLEEDTTGLERWKAKNDGTDDAPHHEHIYWYSAPRGTLCHYQALKKFEDCFDEDDEMWGEEEAESMQAVMNGPDEDEFDEASHDLNDITYSIMKYQDIVTGRDEYQHLFKGNTRLVDILQENLEYFVSAFNDICDELNVTEESVVKVEKFMVNDDNGYGGQCDLVYEDENGEIVVADLKTSSSLRQKHRLQAVAYMKAVEQADKMPDDVDRVEVWRIHPDSETWQVHSHVVPDAAEHLYDEDRPEDASYTDAHWFKDKWGDFEYDSIEDMWQTFKDLSEDAHEAVKEAQEGDDNGD